MRDINRIKPICDEICNLWVIVPDCRFMQLVCNFTKYLGYDGFYLEDDAFIEKFREFVKSCEHTYLFPQHEDNYNI